MKKITNLLIVASLALTGAVMAQEPTPAESQAPTKKEAPGKKPRAEKPAPTMAPKSEAPPVKEPAAKAPPVKEPAANVPPPPKVDRKGPPNRKPVTPATTPDVKTSTEQPATSATPADKKHQSAQTHKDKKSPAANATTSPGTTPATAPTTATPPGPKTTPAKAMTPAAKTTTTPTVATTPAAAATTTPATATATTTPAAAASASTAPSVAAQTSPAASVNPAAVKKPDPVKIQQIQQQHATFRAQPRPDRVPAVTFSANFRLPGSEQWQGPQYEVYRSYHPERHDQGWYRQHYQRVELIGGGYYYFNNGYWYPAWGYNPTNEYYAYDAPIYVGKHAEPPDKVIANVQAVLQDMGYYRGEVDGLLGPLTREALTGYQRDHGMTVTAVIDEPTLASLDMG
ncbi:MAG TPA: peptidoglycan-binding protein [Chthoniobacterales bacterium]|nr:peptidoglycan-binding protein [Chthoniobacterales bacterium]